MRTVASDLGAYGAGEMVNILMGMSIDLNVGQCWYDCWEEGGVLLVYFLILLFSYLMTYNTVVLGTTLYSEWTIECPKKSYDSECDPYS